MLALSGIDTKGLISFLLKGFSPAAQKISEGCSISRKPGGGCFWLGLLTPVKPLEMPSMTQSIKASLHIARCFSHRSINYLTAHQFGTKAAPPKSCPSKKKCSHQGGTNAVTKVLSFQ